MYIIKHTVCNARGPNNVLTLDYDRAGRPVRLQTHVRLREQAFHAFVERTQHWGNVRVDEWEHYATTQEEAWACFPALLAEPDDWYRNVHACV